MDPNEKQIRSPQRENLILRGTKKKDSTTISWGDFKKSFSDDPKGLPTQRKKLNVFFEKKVERRRKEEKFTFLVVKCYLLLHIDYLFVSSLKAKISLIHAPFGMLWAYY